MSVKIVKICFMLISLAGGTSFFRAGSHKRSQLQGKSCFTLVISCFCNLNVVHEPSHFHWTLVFLFEQPELLKVITFMYCLLKNVRPALEQYIFHKYKYFLFRMHHNKFVFIH